MSKRRKRGDEVWLSPNSGFAGDSHRFKVQIIDEDRFNPVYELNGKVISESSCCLDCGDDECNEWPNVRIVQAPEGKENLIGKSLCHVSECEMHDEPQTERILG